MPPAPIRTKEAKAKAAQSASKGKKKWSKGKMKEKANNAVVLDKATLDKLSTDFKNGKQKVLTPHVVSDRYKVTLSLAKKVLREYEAKGFLRAVSTHSSNQIYTSAAPAAKEEAPAATASA